MKRALLEEVADMLRRGVDPSTVCRHADDALKPRLTVEASAPVQTSPTIPQGDVVAFPGPRQQRSHE